jgi:DNA-binding SARP family transcriptional activator
VTRIILATVLTESGEYADAAYHIAKIRRFGKGVGSLTFEYLCLVIEALIALNRQDKKQCLERMNKAIAISKAQGIRCFLCFKQSHIAHLLATAIEAGLEREYIKDLIRRNNLTPPIYPIEKGDAGWIWMEDWPWQIKIFTLGRFEIFKDDKKVEFSGKTQKKPLELLKTIISLGGRDVSEKDISDALWPDSDGDMAHQSFKITLRRLRKLLRREDAVQLLEGRVTLDQRYCWVDASLFENILEQCDANIITVNKDKAIQAVEKAVAMYKGHFLSGDAAGERVIQYREGLRDKFIRCVGRLGEYYEEKGEIDKAIAIYNKGIAIDGLVEKFYHRLMLCHKRTGNRNEALRVYKNCAITFSAVLGTEPSYEMQAIHKSFLNPSS